MLWCVFGETSMDLSNMKSSITLLILTLAALVKEGVAITCYMCNSAPTRNAHLCEDVKNTTNLFVQDCDLLTHPENLSYNVCRKIHQTIIDNDGNQETRVIRQCGSDSPLGCQWKSRPNTLQVEYCHCTTDLCNAASRPVCKLSAGLLCTAAVWICVSLFLRCHFRGADIL